MAAGIRKPAQSASGIMIRGRLTKETPKLPCGTSSGTGQRHLLTEIHDQNGSQNLEYFRISRKRASKKQLPERNISIRAAALALVTFLIQCSASFLYAVLHPYDWPFSDHNGSIIHFANVF